MKHIITSVILSSLLASTLYAVPAFPGTIAFKQKDGSTFKGNLKGDEYFSWVEDKAQNIILYNKKSKQYEYAKVIKTPKGEIDIAPSKIAVPTSASMKANSIKPLSIPKIDHKILYKIWKKKRESGKLN